MKWFSGGQSDMKRSIKTIFFCPSTTPFLLQLQDLLPTPARLVGPPPAGTPLHTPAPHTGPARTQPSCRPPQLALRYTPPLASRASPRSRALCVREHAHQTSPWTSLTQARSRASSNHTQLYSYHVTWPPLPCARAPAPSNPYRQLPPALYSYLTLAAILIPYAR